MITTKFISVKTNNLIQDYYKNLGYDFKCNDTINVDIKHLSTGSHYIVDITCDKCLRNYEFEFRGVFKYVDKEYECRSCMSKRLIKDGTRKKFNKEMNRKISDNTKIKMLDENYKSNYYKKRRKTLLDNHGNETFNNQEKRRRTMLENGTSDYRQSIVNTMMERHGMIFNNQEKKKQTTFDRYGVYHTNQVPEFFRKMQISSFLLKKHDDTGLFYRGSYEKDFLDFCYTNNISVDNFDGNIKYTEKNVYYPDFFIKDFNLIIEIKSTYILERYYDVSMLKRKACLDQSYLYLFIIDKKYEEFADMISNLKSFI